ncbi:toxin-antitoxin system YwqK family antitoxin [Paenibacillus psychroresistens]|uniref:hypothetical protein n=1 Tax=Paenibacillus psychroresistens TaxID=1778678 RepID=UPI001D03A31C|nr:hypothetical protein [Paenibacillus psychroresistens]
MIEDKPDGYWEWYRPDGTIKHSGYFDRGEPVGEWVTYDSKGNKHKTTIRDKEKKMTGKSIPHYQEMLITTLQSC